MNQPNKTICLYFQVHQPYRLSDCSFFCDSDDHDLFRGPLNYENKAVFNKVADKCYLPATRLFLELLWKHPEFRLSYSLSGVFIEQCLQFPEKGEEILDLFRQMAATGRVEFLAETYYHSLAFLYSKLEFVDQISLHTRKIQELFGQKPRIFRNTELIYSNELAEFVRQLGFRGILAEGWDPHLGNHEPQYLRAAKPMDIASEENRIAQQHRLHMESASPLPILLKNYKLSDDIAFRFGNRGWPEYPLNATKYAGWLDTIAGDTINLFMDYETVGEHQWEDTGIFEFFRALPAETARQNIGWLTPSETIERYQVHEIYDVPYFLSWADTERDLSAWAENEIQSSAIEALSLLEKRLHPHRETTDPAIREIIASWRRLQTSDNLYYMSTKYWNDGDVHKYFSPYESPYDAYITFMNSLRLLGRRLDQATPALNSTHA